jgi:hypothetical protein
MDNTYTVAQADDLARYFLGPTWRALHAGYAGYELYEWTANVRHFAPTWREVFRKAGVKLPVRRHFAHVGRRVMHGGEAVASCVSNSMAERIANALNRYTPGSRGT